MILTENGNEIYEGYPEQIKDLFKEYCDKNNLEESYNNRNIDDNDAYCIWRYIYINLFKPDKKTIRYNNKTSKLDYGDIYVLHDILDAYIDLCFAYKILPKVNDFSTMTGISRDTLNSWERGEYRAGDPGASFKHSDLIKKIRQKTSEMGINDLHGNPIGQQSLANNWDGMGLMFTQKEIRAQAEASMISQLSREEIRARFQASEEFREKPQLPDGLD